MRTFTVLLLVLLALVNWSSAYEEARAEMLASRDKRRRQLENVLKNARKQLEDHESGKKLLKPHQVEHHKHKLHAYEEQVKELSRELEEEEILERIKNYEMMKNKNSHDEL